MQTLGVQGPLLTKLVGVLHVGIPEPRQCATFVTDTHRTFGPTKFSNSRANLISSGQTKL